MRLVFYKCLPSKCIGHAFLELVTKEGSKGLTGVSVSVVKSVLDLIINGVPKNEVLLHLHLQEGAKPTNLSLL